MLFVNTFMYATQYDARFARAKFGAKLRQLFEIRKMDHNIFLNGAIECMSGR